jgi:hypothetical protein
LTGGTKLKKRAEKLRHLLSSGESTRLIVVDMVLDGRLIVVDMILDGRLIVVDMILDGIVIKM